MTPGPIAINTATFVGTQVAGIPGGIFATLGFVSPACIIVSFLAWFYFKYKNLRVVQGILEGLRPATVALIASAGLSIFIISVWGEQGFSLNIKSIDMISVAFVGIGIFIIRKWKVNPIYIMLGSGVIGGIVYSIF